MLILLAAAALLLAMTHVFSGSKETGDSTYAVELTREYQLSKSEWRGGRLKNREAAAHERLNKGHSATTSKASEYISSKYDLEGLYGRRGAKADFDRSATFKKNIVLGADSWKHSTTATEVGSHAYAPPDQIDLLKTVKPLRDATMDGSHRASQTERHFANIWDPFASGLAPVQGAAASFTSSLQLRDQYRKHNRSQYHPEQKYDLPPTEQCVIGWGVTDKYGQACAKYNEWAAWHGRTGSHITKFSERLLLGPRHHLSAPFTKPDLHY